MTQEPTSDPVLAFVGGALLVVGWLSLVLGGLCTAAIGVFSIIGVGDGSGHASLEDWIPAVVMLGFGGGCIWAGRQMRRSARKAEDDGPAT